MDEKNTRCSDILKMMFNLKDADLETYKHVITIGEVRADELANKVGKDRTTVYRSLERLVKSGLCEKKKMTLKNGGNYYLYVYREPTTVKKMLQQCVEEWYSSMKNTLNELERHLTELDF